MSETIACPKCATDITVDPGFRPWCPECGWGCEPQVEAPSGLFDRIYRRLGQRQGERLFSELKNSKQAIGKPKRTAAFLMASLLAIPVHLTTVVLLAAGLWFLIATWFHWIPALIGLALIGGAYALRPRFGGPPDAHVLSREEAPALYGLVDEVARKMGTETVDEIYVHLDINAGYGQYGIRQKSYLILGAPLWLSYDGGEKVALIAHELAHQVNGDATRGFWIRNAIDTLANWHAFLRPPHPDTSPRFNWHGTDDWIGESLATYYFSRLLSIPVSLLLNALVHLSWNSSQRAEYLADYLGSRVSGTEKFIASDERLSVLTDNADQMAESIKRHVHAPEKIVPDFVSKFETIPTREMERVRRINKSELLTLDATHPPTYYRCAMLEAFPCPAQLTLTGDQVEKLNAEVASLNKALGKELINLFLPNL